MNTRRGLGKGLGTGYYNIAPMDSHIHSLSAKGMKTKLCPCKTVKKVFNLNGYSRGNMHTVTLDPEYSIVTYSEGTRNGFRHVAILMRNGYEQDKVYANYLNRTWESYEFQTVIHKLLRKSFDENKAKILMEDLDSKGGRSLMAKGKSRLNAFQIKGELDEKGDRVMTVGEFQNLSPEQQKIENKKSWKRAGKVVMLNQAENVRNEGILGYLMAKGSKRVYHVFTDSKDTYFDTLKDAKKQVKRWEQFANIRIYSEDKYGEDEELEYAKGEFPQ